MTYTVVLIALASATATAVGMLLMQPPWLAPLLVMSLGVIVAAVNH